MLVDRFFHWCLVGRREERRKRGKREKREEERREKEERERESSYREGNSEKKRTKMQTTPLNTAPPNTNTPRNTPRNTTPSCTHRTPTVPRTTDRDHANAIYDTFATPVMSVVSASCHRHVDHAPSGAIKFEDIVRCECNSGYSLVTLIDLVSSLSVVVHSDRAFASSRPLMCFARWWFKMLAKKHVSRFRVNNVSWGSLLAAGVTERGTRHACTRTYETQTAGLLRIVIEIL